MAANCVSAMASGRSWLLCLAIATVQLCVVCGQNMDKERFPLSGGVDNGVNVRLTVGNVEDSVNVDFLTPDRQSIFNWFVDVVNQKIQRKVPSMMDAQSQDWGLWLQKFAITPNEPVIFDFYKTKYGWKVSIDETRRPWLDVAWTADMKTPVHVEVSTNASKFIIQTRPICDTKCHESECNSTEGEFSCPEGEDCYTRQVLMDESHARCYATKDSGDYDDMQCCTGVRQPVDIRSVAVKQWVQVLDSSEFVTQSCRQYSVGLENPLSDDDVNLCMEATGTVVRIEAKNETEGLLTVWAPSLASVIGAQEGQTVLRMPPHLLFDKEPTKQFVDVHYTVLGSLVDADDPNKFINQTDGFILQLSEEAVNMTQNYFINMMTSADGLGRWYRWFTGRFQYTHSWYDTCDKEGHVQFILSDEEVPATECEDDMVWEDSEGRNCTIYTNNEWCTEFGEATDAFKAEFPDKDLFAFGNDSSAPLFSCDRSRVNWAAPWACCACGGGYHAVPSEVVEPVLFQ